MDLKIKKKRALVLGASSGLGFAVAKGLGEEGVQVALCSRDPERIAKASQQIPGSLGIACDLDKKGQATRLVEQVIATWGGIDILFLNTGGPPAGIFEKLSLADWQQGFDKLYVGAIECLQAALPGMKKQKWGRIVFNTSTAAKEPIQSLVISSGLRAGLLGLMKTLSREVAPYQITVNAILPGYTRTERLAELGRTEEAMAKEVPLGRIGTPEEFAALAVFLSSEPAAYMTGQAIACDGGQLHGL